VFKIRTAVQVPGRYCTVFTTVTFLSNYIFSNCPFTPFSVDINIVLR